MRSYLLISEPGTKDERHVSVRSSCRKEFPAEGAYGKCEHAIEITPGDRRFKLTTGEDVVLTLFTWDTPFLVTTLEYGCCAGPYTARFYDAAGKYVGLVQGYDLASRQNGESVFTRNFDFGNGTRYGDNVYFLVARNEEMATSGSYDAIVFGKGTRSRLPVHFKLPERKCSDWVISDFVAYGDHKDITLKLRGMFCGENDESFDAEYSCGVEAGAIPCKR